MTATPDTVGSSLESRQPPGARERTLLECVSRLDKMKKDRLLVSQVLSLGWSIQLGLFGVNALRRGLGVWLERAVWRSILRP